MPAEPAMDWRVMTPEDSPKGLPDVYADPRLADLRTPNLAPGDPAFDFELPVYDFSRGTKQSTGETMRLSKASRARPVALVFGSYT
jgi:hypothetical protein